MRLTEKIKEKALEIAIDYHRKADRSVQRQLLISEAVGDIKSNWPLTTSESISLMKCLQKEFENAGIELK